MNDFIVDIMLQFSLDKERILIESFRKKFHADMKTLIEFAPQDFKCCHAGEREEYYWCDKVIAVFSFSYEWTPEPKIIMNVLQ